MKILSQILSTQIFPTQKFGRIKCYLVISHKTLFGQSEQVFTGYKKFSILYDANNKMLNLLLS